MEKGDNFLKLLTNGNTFMKLLPFVNRLHSMVNCCILLLHYQTHLIQNNKTYFIKHKVHIHSLSEFMVYFNLFILLLISISSSPVMLIALSVALVVFWNSHHCNLASHYTFFGICQFAQMNIFSTLLTVTRI